MGSNEASHHVNNGEYHVNNVEKQADYLEDHLELRKILYLTSRQPVKLY